jgi:hypothetical protein
MAIFSGPEIVNDGLVLHLDAANLRSYPGSGTTWSDLNTGGNNGELVNSPIYSNDFKGYFSFATNTLIKIPNDTRLDLQTVTVEVWFKTNALSQNGFLFEKGLVNTQYNLFFESNTLRWRHKRVGTAFVNTIGITTANFITTDKWYQVVATWQSGLQGVYINGVLVGSNTLTGVLDVNNRGMSLGAYGGFDGSRGYYLNGSISTCRVYNKVLTSIEIKQNFEATRSRYGV